MTPQPALDPRLFADYLAGTCTPMECAEVERWAAVDPARVQLLSDLRAMWRQVPHRTRPSVDLDTFIRRVEARIAAETAEQQERHRVPSPRRLWLATAGLAFGAIALTIGLGVTHAHLSSHAGAVATYVTANGERAKIRLTDGTVVSLDVASRLEVPADYPAGNRTVRLTGAALFAVSHNVGTPFTVLAGSTTTRVLGTSFLVRHYATDTVTTVAVHDGKVAVHAATTPSTVVTAARQAEIFTSGAVHLLPVDPAQFAFVTGMLKFDRVPLPAAIPELNRWYDVDIQLGAPTLATQRVTAEFAAGSAADLSDILSLMFDVRVVRQGRVLTLYPR